MISLRLCFQSLNFLRLPGPIVYVSVLISLSIHTLTSIKFSIKSPLRFLCYMSHHSDVFSKDQWPTLHLLSLQNFSPQMSYVDHSKSSGPAVPGPIVGRLWSFSSGYSSQVQTKDSNSVFPIFLHQQGPMGPRGPSGPAGSSVSSLLSITRWLRFRTFMQANPGLYTTYINPVVNCHSCCCPPGSSGFHWTRWWAWWARISCEYTK